MSSPTSMPFEAALRGLKGGARLQRAAWNGRGQWVALVLRPPRVRMPVMHRWGPMGMAATESRTIAAHDLDLEPYFILRNAHGLVSTWVPSIGDLLADDWQEYLP
jgi:hypothetical protein